MRDFPFLATKGRDDRKTYPTSFGSSAPMQNKFYALQTQQHHNDSPNVVTDMLKEFQLDAYALLDLGATLSFVTPYVAMRFDVDPDILYNPFHVSTHTVVIFGLTDVRWHSCISQVTSLSNILKCL
ncbi:hypothetical protein MTR67_011706 [Solanum verrucosum]|uniref:Gag-pol polyprotein n=1 Tax=Solanum verrucosum TaxID=315347 RepID=A0AAF0TGC7_SOLVR|nr:hypothetical protein MTR67_011706 [Solanum verrucosum]